LTTPRKSLKAINKTTKPLIFNLKKQQKMKITVKKIACILVIGSIVLACNSKKAGDDIAKLKDEVMSVHDALMPETMAAEELTTKLEAKLAGMDKSSKSYAAEKAKIDSLTGLLNGASDEMMTWMNEYSEDSLSKMNDADAVKYLESEKRKINQVKELTDKNFGIVKDYLK
jgi:hypothetical protein